MAQDKKLGRKKPTMTEEIAKLKKDNDELSTINSNWANNDERKRKDITQMLMGGRHDHRFIVRGSYRDDSYTRESGPYSWAEIFFELGKVMAKRDYLDLAERFADIQQEVKGTVERLEHGKFPPQVGDIPPHLRG